MTVFLQLKRAWGAIRWKMLTIFVFFSIVSMILVGCFAVAILNVVIRRESAYLLEERIKMIVYERKDLIDSVMDGAGACSEPRSNSLQSVSRADGAWSRVNVMVLPWKQSGTSEQPWRDTGDFAGIIADRGQLEVRSFRWVAREGCSVMLSTIRRCEAGVRPGQFAGTRSAAEGAAAAIANCSGSWANHRAYLGSGDRRLHPLQVEQAGH